MRFPRPPILAQDDIATVEFYLRRSSGPIADFEMLDGFFAALVIGPNLFSPFQFLPLLLGVSEDQGLAAMPDLAEAQDLLEQIQKHWNRLVTTFMEGEPLGLWLRDPEGPQGGRRWARGFMVAMDLDPDWDRLVRRRRHAPLFRAVLALAYEDVDDEALRMPPVSPAERQDLIGNIAVGLPELYAANRPGAVAPAPGRSRSPMRRKPGSTPRKKAAPRKRKRD
jgi:uncharacterized protein